MINNPIKIIIFKIKINSQIPKIQFKIKNKKYLIKNLICCFKIVMKKNMKISNNKNKYKNKIHNNLNKKYMILRIKWKLNNKTLLIFIMVKKVTNYY